jgi:hypothetical protein
LSTETSAAESVKTKVESEAVFEEERARISDAVRAVMESPGGRGSISKWLVIVDP